MYNKTNKLLLLFKYFWKGLLIGVALLNVIDSFQQISIMGSHGSKYALKCNFTM